MLAIDGVPDCGSDQFKKYFVLCRGQIFTTGKLFRNVKTCFDTDIQSHTYGFDCSALHFVGVNTFFFLFVW